MTAKTKAGSSPAGQPASEAAKGRASRSEAYGEARDEYAAIRALRERNWIAAHIRERRYELDLTQQQVAEQAGTSHSFISKLEGGDHIPTIPVLQRILAVLDEALLIGIPAARCRHGSRAGSRPGTGTGDGLNPRRTTRAPS